jgi:PAS domain S-box-containing protein
MNLRAAFASRRAVAWGGALFIGVVVALEGYNVLRNYRSTVESTGRELDTQARVLAEQAARTIQAVDVQLRHLAQQFRDGSLSGLSDRDLRAYLKDYALGIVQIEGLLVVNADGSIRTSSYMTPEQEAPVNLHDRHLTRTLRDDPRAGLVISPTEQSVVDKKWMFPLGRRLDTSSGAFAGVVAARAKIEYFQDFYRDVRLDEGTKISLMQLDGTLLARYPEAEGILGKRLPLFNELFAAHKAGELGPSRFVSTIDGVERFGALRLVPDYPLAVVVTRDAGVALAPWRAQTWRVLAHVLLLSALAGVLLWVVMRQLSRLQTARESLAESEERFALAVAGSNDGIIDWDIATGRFYSSKRAMEIVGIDSDVTERSRDEWVSLVRYQDRARAREDLLRFLASRDELRDVEYAVLLADGSPRWVRHRHICVRDASGRALRLVGSVSDTTAQKRAEQALRESEERFSLAVAGANDGIIDWDIVNDRVYASRRAIEIVGVDSGVAPRTRAEWVGGINYHPEDRAVASEDLDRFLAGRDELRDIQYRVLLPDGGIRWVRHRHLCVRDAGGKALRLVGSVSDITAQMRAEAALRESEERFALAVAGSNDGLIDWDIVNDRMYTSPRTLQICGVDSKETLRTRAEWLALLRLHPKDRERHTEDLREFLAGTNALREGDYRVQLADGKYRWVRVRNLCVRDAVGRPIRLAGSVSDIDAEKRAEAALRESEARYQLAVNGSNQGLWDWDLLSDKLFLSPRAQEFMGIAPGEPLRPRREWVSLSPYHPDDLEAVRKAISDHVHGLTPFFTTEYRMRHPSGEWHWYRQRGLALRDDRGRAYRMAGSMEDITGEKSAEAERMRLEGQLLQAKKLEAIGTLAGGIAHDFNNILSAILGYGEMAQKDAKEGTPLRRHLDAALSAGHRAKSLVERILAFSRSGMGERVPVHVESVVSEALDLVAASLPKGVKLARKLDAGDAAVLGDPTQIHQVVMNLCTNGVQAMKSGGTLTVALDVVEKSGERVATSVLSGGRYLRLAVGDTGSGIPAKVLERIFDPFFTTKEVGVGTGLGLSLVYGIVTDLGGGIDVESRPGEGATFTVYLPWSSAVAAPASVDEAVPEGSGETILLVDDEEPLVRLGEEMIAGLGYEPVGFTSSAAALQSFRASPGRFHAVLSDEAMPEMTGSELAKEIRSIRPDIPIVLMSGFVSPALLGRARDLGVREVLAKPLVERDIARGLANALKNGARP